MATTNSIFNTADPTTPGKYGPSQTALLLIDFHTRFVERAGGPLAPAALQEASTLRTWAKSQGIQVVHCLLDTAQTPFPTSKDIQRYSGVMEIMRTADGGGQEHAALLEGDNKGDDVTFLRRPGTGSALCSPGLAEFLKSKGIVSLIIAGLPTSGSVARTAFAAGDAEYVVTVISDATVDPDESVHRTFVESVLGARGYVTTAAAFQEGFESVHKK